jgi:excisionase family DNA binding protein
MGTRMLSRQEVADQLGLGLATVKRGIRDGWIPSAKVGKRRLVPRAWVDEQVTGQPAEPEPEPEPVTVEQAVEVLMKAGAQSAEVQRALRKLNRLPIPR